jgi:hypothetical protein
MYSFHFFSTARVIALNCMNTDVLTCNGHNYEAGFPRGGGGGLDSLTPVLFVNGTNIFRRGPLVTTKDTRTKAERSALSEMRT